MNTFKIIESKEYWEWFDSIADRQSRSRIDARLRRLARGHFGDCRSVGGGVYELRIHCGSGYRVYFVRRGERLIVLLSGGDKSSQVRDIHRAKRVAEERWEGSRWEE